MLLGICLWLFFYSFIRSFVRSFFYSAIKHFDSLINVTLIIVDHSQTI